MEEKVMMIALLHLHLRCQWWFQVYNQGFVINLSNNRTNIPKVDGEFDQRALILSLQDIKDRYPR